MAKLIPQVEYELERRVAGLGFELVQIEWAGSRHRPVLRVRIDVTLDLQTSGGGVGVSVGDCATVSRGLEPWLDELDVVPDRYVLEVSSPGLDRPLTRERDWDRFVGRHVALKGPSPLAGRAKYLEGELLGRFRGSNEREVVRLRLDGGDEVEVAREAITGAHLVHRWN